MAAPNWTVEKARISPAVTQTVLLGGDSGQEVIAVFYGPNAIKNATRAAATTDLEEAVVTLLNIEGAAMAGGQLPAWRGLDVAYHFKEARAALRKAKGLD